MPTKCRVMENYGYWQAINSRFLVLRFEMHASQIQGCVVEQRVEKKRKIAESVWVHNVVTVRTGRQGGWPVCNALYAKVAS